MHKRLSLWNTWLFRSLFTSFMLFSFSSSFVSYKKYFMFVKNWNRYFLHSFIYIDLRVTASLSWTELYCGDGGGGGGGTLESYMQWSYFCVTKSVLFLVLWNWPPYRKVWWKWNKAKPSTLLQCSPLHVQLRQSENTPQILEHLVLIRWPPTNCNAQRLVW